jgi:hypothetical protein
VGRGARASTPNAHYTSPEVIRAMHALLGRLGFTGGRILEPSMGAGYFLGLDAAAQRADYRWTGVELDSVTGRIAKLLYPESDVRVQGFEKLNRPDGHFDAAVGNVPFGNYKVHDPRYNALKLSIHNYFFGRRWTSVRPGGVMRSSRRRSRWTSATAACGRAREACGPARGHPAPGRRVQGHRRHRRHDGPHRPAPPRRGRGAGGRVDEGGGDDGAWEGRQTSIPLNEYYAAHPEHVLGELRGDGTMNARFGGGGPRCA